MSSPHIPVDIYDSPQEFVIIMPLGGTTKSSISLHVEGKELVISGMRTAPVLKPSLTCSSSSCFRGEFVRRVALPVSAATDRIQSQLSAENILTVIVPKIVSPEKIIVEIQ